MANKKADMIQQVIVHIILVVMIFSLFFVALSGTTSSRDVKRQVVEKQIALLIDSAEPGMLFSITRENINGIIDNLEIKNNRVFASVNGYSSAKGYPYFSGNEVYVEQNDEKFIVKIR